MPSLSSIRELIAYVPTMKNISTRGNLTGIPYLGDTFNYEDQQLINSISGESVKQNKNTYRSMNSFFVFFVSILGSFFVFIFILIRKQTR